jgi:hypothetical protein
VSKENDRVVLGFVLYQLTEIVHVVVQSKGHECARTLIAATVVSYEVERIETSSETGKRAPAVKCAVNTDDSRPGVGDAPIGDGEPWDW